MDRIRTTNEISLTWRNVRVIVHFCSWRLRKVFLIRFSVRSSDHLFFVSQGVTIFTAPELQSLDLPTILASGYSLENTFTRIPRKKTRTKAAYRLSSKYSFSDQPPGRKRALTLRCHLPGVQDDKVTIRQVPYIDDNQRLRIWKLDQGEPLQIIGRGVVDGAMLPEEVRRRYPPMFAFAQSLGYWLDVK